MKISKDVCVEFDTFALTRFICDHFNEMEDQDDNPFQGETLEPKHVTILTYGGLKVVVRVTKEE